MTNSNWSAYKKARYIKMIVRLFNGDVIGAELTYGYLGNKTEEQLRSIIQNITGQKFVYGFDPNDASMVSGKPSTYGWFIPTPTPSYR